MPPLAALRCRRWRMASRGKNNNNNKSQEQDENGREIGIKPKRSLFPTVIELVPRFGFCIPCDFYFFSSFVRPLIDTQTHMCLLDIFCCWVRLVVHHPIRSLSLPRWKHVTDLFVLFFFSVFSSSSLFHMTRLLHYPHLPASFFNTHTKQLISYLLL